MTRCTLFFLLIIFALLGNSCQSEQAELELVNGMTIQQSVTIKPGTYFLAAKDSLQTAVITIEGENIEVDFNNAVLQGSKAGQLPNTFSGLAILVKNGKNIRIKNAIVKGYKVGMMAVSVDSLQITASDFSYNYRQRLKSTRTKEDVADWMSYHNNEKDEWLRYGAAVYLKNCRHALVRQLRVTGGQNGLLMTGCQEGLFYNNDLRFNSGLGIGMYRSSHNRVMHNRLDWNIRGYSHGVYNRGQDSAGLLAYEQCQHNTFAFNSATHSGDGFFLWAGNETMESGEGGCNYNVFYANDCSYASNNGIEITFSGHNKLTSNRIDGCDYALWGGYSYNTTCVGNKMSGNRIGISFEHGNANDINYNVFDNSKIGVQLWERAEQPNDWAFAQKRDVSSRGYRITDNHFLNVAIPLKISHTKEAEIFLNYFYQFDKLFEASAANDKMRFLENRIYQEDGWGIAAEMRDKNTLIPDKTPPPFQLPNMLELPLRITPLPDGQDVLIPEEELRGRQYMLVDEWGPYDFRSPSIWLREVNGTQYSFTLFGPAEGNWKLTGGTGFSKINQDRGSFPSSLVAERDTTVSDPSIRLEYIGQAFTDRFGNDVKRGQAFEFVYN